MSGASGGGTLAQVPEDSTVGTLTNSACTSSTVLTDGGYDYELLVSDTDSRYECPICLLYLRDPVLTTCGHRFCEKCISKWVIKEGGKCPVDGVPLEYENIFPDNFTRREILQCRAKCPFGKDGCSVVLSLSELEKHIHSIHNPSGTPTSSSLKSHNGSHGSLVECYYKEVGCVNFFPQENLQRHLELDMHHHLQLLTAAYRRLKLSRPQDHFIRQDSRDSTRWLLADEAMDSDDYQFRRQRSWDSVRFARQTHSRPRFEDRLAESEESLCKGKGEIQEKGPLLPKGDRGAESANGSGSGSPIHLKEVFDRLVRLEQSDREKQIKLDRLESQLSSALKLFSTVTQAMDDLTARYCNGVYVWKVPSITKQFSNMRRHPNSFLCSAGFYTGVHEYKVCIRFNLNILRSGEGAVGGVPLEFPPLDKDEDTALGVNIHFMKGEFDDILRWPFTGEIRLDIINSDPKLSLTEGLQSRPGSSAFGRPSENINKSGFGYSNFCTVAKLFSPGFIQNDSLIFKVYVTPSRPI